MTGGNLEGRQPRRTQLRNNSLGRRELGEEEAQKEEAQEEEARNERARREAAQREEARKERARKEAAQREEARKERTRREAAQREEAWRERARKEAAQKEEALAALKQKLHDLRKQLVELESIRAELAAVKAQIRSSASDPVIWGRVALTFLPLLSRPSGIPQVELGSLKIPDVRDVDRQPRRLPIDPAIASLPAVIREQLQEAPPPKSAVEEAKTYLIVTARPGYTMKRQGISLAIERLHPGFVVKLAEALKRAHDEGMTEAGIFSAYRPPAFGVGGFRDKFDSLHSYGLATDIAGIGGPGSASAHRWYEIVRDVGLHLPYGPNNRVEFNHTQFIPAKVAPRELRTTITADGPKDLREMWLASGVGAYVTEPVAVAVANIPANDAGSGDLKPAAPAALATEQHTFDEVMLILRGVANSANPRGQLDDRAALEYARRMGYRGEVLNVAGNTARESAQARLGLERIRRDQTITAIYAFSGGGYNARLMWEELNRAERDRIRKVVVIGSPGLHRSDFAGASEVVIKPDPPEGHLAGPRALLESLGTEIPKATKNSRLE